MPITRMVIRMNNWRKLALLGAMMMLLVVGLVACDDVDEYDEEWDDTDTAFFMEEGDEGDEEWASEDEWDEDEWVFEGEDYCFPGEQYDPETDECYIECDTEEECLELEEAIYGALDEFWDDESELTHFGAPDEDAPALAVYDIGSDFSLILVAGDDAADVELSYLDPEWHNEIWAFTWRLLPHDFLREEVRQFAIFTDGVDETLAYVMPLDDDPDKWLLAIDIADVDAAGTLVNPDFVHTLIHEFAHILTLENDQVPPDYEALELAAQGSDDYSEIAETCETYYTGEGCALPQAYINSFFFRFWEDIYEELPEEDDEDELVAFYEAYADQFVSEYAATNPGEDIAESFTLFVLQDSPAERTIAAEKVRFFYDYPELVQIRQMIRAELARIQAENQ